jgi:hypothetical protein
MTKIALGTGIIALFLVSSGCGGWQFWKDGKNNDASGPSSDTLGDDLTPEGGLDCTACCDGCWQDHTHEQEPPTIPRLVVTAASRPLGYLAGRDGLLLDVISADAKYMLTIHSVTGALVGPEWWHYDASDLGIGCAHQILPVSVGACGSMEGATLGVHTIWNDFADPTGLWKSDPPGVLVARATVGELVTYAFGGRNKAINGDCQLQSHGHEIPIADHAEMCGIRVDNASDLPVTMGPDYFASEYATPIEIIETTTPIDEL